MAEWVSVAEAVEQTPYSHTHLNWLARKGKITARKAGGVWLLDLESLKVYEKLMKELGDQKHSPNREDTK